MCQYSVLMSVYKEENPAFLRLSAESMLNQTLPTDDFVLLCDGPLTEELDAVIEHLENEYHPCVRVIRFEEHRGLGKCLNDGLHLCKHELIARMDSDDIANKLRCEKQVEKFCENPKLDIVGGNVEEFEGDVRNITSMKQMPITNEEIVEYSKLRCPFNHPTVMYRKSAVLAVGGYPDEYRCEDYGLWVRLLQNGSLSENLPMTLCYMRVDCGLHKRRGGVRFLIDLIAFRFNIYSIGYVSLPKTLYVIFVCTAVCLMPNILRKKFYNRFLRLRNSDNTNGKFSATPEKDGEVG